MIDLYLKLRGFQSGTPEAKLRDALSWLEQAAEHDQDHGDPFGVLEACEEVERLICNQKNEFVNQGIVSDTQQRMQRCKELAIKEAMKTIRGIECLTQEISARAWH